MAVATPVRSLKQSERLAATLYSPPETWISALRALRKGITPGSSRWTRAPRARKSSSHASRRTFNPLAATSSPLLLRGLGALVDGQVAVLDRQGQDGEGRAEAGPVAHLAAPL